MDRISTTVVDFLLVNGYKNFFFFFLLKGLCKLSLVHEIMTL